jgi:hypothetical protein
MQFVSVGQWWFNRHKIDVLGLSKEGLVAGECKFTPSAVTEGILFELEGTVDEVRWSDEPTDATTQYVLFSRSGYTGNLVQRAEPGDDLSV